MFRIKTDIRQYKCETKDKVEKLIRNWVIRPTDLIYDTDGKEWAPIGDHPAFVSLFGLLDEQEKNTPDTVVKRSPYADRNGEDDDDGEAEAVDDNGNDDNDATGSNSEIGPSKAALDVVEEVTQLVDRESVAEDRDDEPQEVTQMVGRPTVSDSEAETADSRSTDVFDQDDIADSLSEESRPKPPEAPDGVEAPARDGEVTMMTERTLEMLKITDEDDAVDPDDEDDEESEDVERDEDDEDEEVTGVRERSESADGTDGEDEDEDKNGDDEGDDEPDDDEKETKEKKRNPLTLPKLKKSKALESGPKLGRHDLPEELFATNEISSPEVQEQIKRLDELGELEPSDPTLTDDDDTPASGEWPASQLHEDSGVDEAWEEIAEDLRTTEELDDDLPDSLPSDSEPDEYDDEGEWAAEDTSDHEIPPPGDFVSDGYRVALPFPVRPTADDIRRGMPQGRVSRAAKDRTFPIPQPKKVGDVHTRHFDLTKKPPRDQTFLVAGVVIVIIALITVAIASC